MISEHIKDALDRYVNHGIIPGGFLTRVLSNDLFGAIAQADSENKKALADICAYIYNELPSGAWGSKQIVVDYANSKFQV